MANIKGFTFFKSYYDSLKDLDQETRNKIIEAMLKFVFDNKKPKFNGIEKTIWTLIEPTLLTSKNRSNGNSGAPKGNRNACKIRESEEENNSIKNQSKNNQNSIKNQSMTSLSLSYSLSLSNPNNKYNNILNNNNLINTFINYIKMREEKEYPTNDSTIDLLINKLAELSDKEEEKEKIIEQAIAKEWKDFYPINEKKPSSQGKRRVL